MKIYVTVNLNKALIDKLCRIAFQNGYEVEEWDRPDNLSRFTKEQLEEIINEDICGYRAKVLAFTVYPERKVSEINFLRIHPNPAATTYDGDNRAEVRLAIKWIRDNKM